MTNMFFFGCGLVLGHHWHGPGLSYLSREAWGPLPWINEVDGKLQPGCHMVSRGGREYVETGPQVQGPARLHNRDGWTMLSFWDRSVDHRQGSNGNFLALGTHDFSAMLSLAMWHFPSVIQRLTAPLRPEAS